VNIQLFVIWHWIVYLHYWIHCLYLYLLKGLCYTSLSRYLSVVNHL
jgi:hypothetical protein